MSEELTQKMRGVLRDEPRLILMCDINIWNSQPFIKVCKPGATERSKPVTLLPAMFGASNAGRLSDVLQILVDVMREEGR